MDARRVNAAWQLGVDPVNPVNSGQVDRIRTAPLTGERHELWSAHATRWQRGPVPFEGDGRNAWTRRTPLSNSAARRAGLLESDNPLDTPRYQNAPENAASLERSAFSALRQSGTTSLTWQTLRRRAAC